MTRGARRLAAGTAALCLGAVAACAGEDAPPSARLAPAPADALGAVDGRPVAPADVAWAAGAASLEPAAALTRVVERDLLATAASARGLEADPGVLDVRRRAAVQQLLAESVEAAVPPDAIDDATLRATYDGAGERFRRPERRRAAHVVAVVPEGAPATVDAAAREAVAALIARVEGGERLESVAANLGPPPAPGVEWRAEDLPAWSRDAEADEAFLAALFEPSAPGLVARPVRSRFGWHVIRIEAIEPAVDRAFEDVVDTLRAEEVTRRRAARLEALLEELRAGADVTVDAEGLETFLSLPPGRLGVDPPGALP